MTSLQTAQSRNPYLEGFLAPVRAEVTAADLPVTGHIPEHLDGRYLRNGPNPAEEVDPATYHWFTGDGMVHAVALRDGKAAWYRNRWVRSPSVCAALGEPMPGRLNPREDRYPGSRGHLRRIPTSASGRTGRRGVRCGGCRTADG